jgi:hypothetical protein
MTSFNAQPQAPADGRIDFPIEDRFPALLWGPSANQDARNRSAGACGWALNELPYTSS